MAKDHGDTMQTTFIRDLFEKHFNRKVVDLEPLTGGKNTVVYTVSIGQGTTGQDAPLQPGTSSLPLEPVELIIRLSNFSSMLNESVRVQSEVAAMQLGREALADFNPSIVPLVYGWAKAHVVENPHSDPDSDWTKFSPGWIVMQRMNGVPLNSKFPSLDNDKKREIVSQIARVVKGLQDYQLPTHLQGYGGLDFDSDGSMVLGPTTIYGGGPCKSFAEFYIECYGTQMGLADKCKIVQGWKDSNIRARLDDFGSKGLKKFLDASVPREPRPTLVHGDLDTMNLLYDETTNSVSAVIDWEFACIASPGDEFMRSLTHIGGIIAGPYSGDPDSDLLRTRLLQGFEEGAANMTTEWLNWKTAVAFDEELTKIGAQKPKNIEGMAQISAVYWLMQDVSPGYFFLKRWTDRHTPEEMNAEKARVGDLLDKQLTALGF